MHFHFLVPETQNCTWGPSQCYSEAPLLFHHQHGVLLSDAELHFIHLLGCISEIQFSISYCLLRDLRYALSDPTHAFIVTVLPWPHSTCSWLFGSYCSFPLKSHFFHSDQLVESYFISHLITLTSLTLWLSSGHTLWSFLTNTCYIFLVSSWKKRG